MGICFTFGSLPAKAQENSHEHMHAQAADSLEHCYDETNPRFSMWGWCHQELHALGLIEELLRQVAPDQCCGGPYSGECRIAKVDWPGKRGFVNGRWIPFNYGDYGTQGTKRAIINEIKPGYAIVCSNAPGSQVYCVGFGGGL